RAPLAASVPRPPLRRPHLTRLSGCPQANPTAFNSAVIVADFLGRASSPLLDTAAAPLRSLRGKHRALTASKHIRIDGGARQGAGLQQYDR
ncbi:unnamed protein product, partial [Urochloa humidicola]